MKVRKKRQITLLLTLTILAFLFVEGSVLAQNAIYYGSDPDAVGKVQRKLKEWGYYDYGVDGYYGWRTEEAVKKFQRKNGLDVDGICGVNTLKELGLGNLVNKSRSTSSPKKASGNRSEARLLAQCINGEARGEPYVGQVAVAAVILNRVNHPEFPNSISGVIYQPGAFDAVSDGQIYLEPSESSVKAANDALAGWDPSGGAIYYYNPVTSTNQWILSRPIIAEIGKHVFCD